MNADRTYCLLAVLLVATGAMSPLVAADTGEPIKEILPNGMTLIVQANHAAPVVAARVYTKTGAAYEAEHLGAGLSHYLEHVLGHGSKTRTADEINRIIEEIGNNSNAYTSKDHTCYYISTGSEFFETALDVLAEYVTQPDVPKEEVEEQRGIILREMAMRDDQPRTVLYNLFMETAFRVHPHRYRTIGYPARFKQATYDDLFAYHAQRYVPDNMICVVAGDVDPEQALTKMREAFGQLERRPQPPLSLPEEPRQQGPRRRVVVEPDLQKTYLMMGYHTVPISHPDLYPLDVLSFILSNGRSSRLVRTIREEQKLVDAISTWSATPRYDAGTFVVSATLDTANLAAAEQAILAEMERVRTKSVGKGELAKAKAQVAADRVFQQERVEDQAASLGSGEVMTGDPSFDKRYVEGIRAVTARDVLRAAQTYFVEDSYVFCALTPEAEREVVDKAGEGLGAIQSRRLPNGMKLLIQESRATPSVTLVAVLEGGLRYETEATNGISHLMSNILVRGTKRLSREKLNELIESVGGSIGPWSGRDSFGVTVNVLKEDFDRGLHVLADVLQNSTFPAEEFETQRKLQLAGIAGEQDDAYRAAYRLLFDALFTEHPYRFQQVGTAESAAGLTREQAVELYRALCRPGNMILCVFGDVDANAVEAAANEAFGSFEGERGIEATPELDPPLAETRTVAKQRPQEQAILVWGFRGMKADDPDRYALEVLDAAFSGIGLPGGRLHETLRGQSLVYGTHLVTYAMTDPGFIIMYAATAPDKVEVAEQTVARLVRELHDAPMSAEEIERGKSMCIASHQLRLQANSDRAMMVALDELRGLGYDNFTKYVESIRKVAPGDVQRVAKKYLTMDACAYVKTLPEEGAQ